jgi:hypothetical protein
MAADIKPYHLRNPMLNDPDNQRLLNEERHSQHSEKGREPGRRTDAIAQSFEFSSRHVLIS